MALFDGLLWRWKFDEASGNIAYDSSPNLIKKDGTVSGATVAPGKVNNCRYFDGIDDQIYGAGTDGWGLGVNNISQAAWFKVEDWISVREIIGTGGRLNLIVYITGQVTASFYDGAWYSLFGPVVQANVWYLMVHVKTPLGQKMYLGKEGDSGITFVASDAAGGNIQYTYYNTTVSGDRKFDGLVGNLFRGYIDEAAQWNKVLTDGGVALGQLAGGEVAEYWSLGAGLLSGRRRRILTQGGIWA